MTVIRINVILFVDYQLLKTCILCFISTTNEEGVRLHSIGTKPLCTGNGEWFSLFQFYYLLIS